MNNCARSTDVTKGYMPSELIRLNGLFVGMLTEHEMEIFEHAISKGMAMRWYQGGAGFMGLAKVKVTFL